MFPFSGETDNKSDCNHTHYKLNNCGSQNRSKTFPKIVVFELEKFVLKKFELQNFELQNLNCKNLYWKNLNWKNLRWKNFNWKILHKILN